MWPTPRSFDRQTPEAIQDAVADLYLLRFTNYFVGTYGSTFSNMVMVGRDIPHTFCAPETPEDERVARVIHAAGLEPLVRLTARRHFGGAVPFTLACWWFVRVPQSLISRLRKRINGRRTKRL